MIKIHVTKEIGKLIFNDETDIVITDPCYILKDFEYYRYPEKYKNTIFTSTIYGDWSCTVFDKDELKIKRTRDLEKIYGKFCADAGLVTVMPLEEVLKAKPDWKEWSDKHDWCTTTIPNFKGTIFVYNGYITIDPNAKDNWWKEQEKNPYNLCCWIESEGNINFITLQTGF